MQVTIAGNQENDVDEKLDEAEIMLRHIPDSRGKDVGEYLKSKRHYNISSSIRKKLGIDTHDTNLGIYIRELMETV